MEEFVSIERPQPLNPRQFPEQLTLFEKTEDVINHVHKGDSFVRSIGPANHSRGATPREQWEVRPHGRPSLRDYKRQDLETDERYEGAKPSTMGPIDIEHNAQGDKYMNDGHHRLAFAERHKMPLVPVTHRENNWR